MKKSSQKADKKSETKKSSPKGDTKALKIAAGVATAAGVLGLLLKNKDKISGYLQGNDTMNSSIEKALIYKNEQLQTAPVEETVPKPVTLPLPVPQVFPENKPVPRVFPENGPVQVIINNYTSQEPIKTALITTPETVELPLPPVTPETPETQNSCIIL